MTARQLTGFVLRWSWLLLIGASIAAAISYQVTSQQPKVYEAQTKLLVGSADLTSGAGDYGGLQTVSQLASTYSRVITTRPIIEAAIDAGKLELNYDAAASMVSAAPVAGTHLIQIAVRAADPSLAAKLGNLVAAAFMQQIEASQTSRYAAVENALARQLDELGATQADLSRRVEQIRADPPSTSRDVELARAQFDLTQAQQTYAAAQRSYQDVLLTKARSTNPITVVEAATPSGQPTQGQEKQNAVVAAGLGLLIVLVAAYAAELLDDRLLSADRIQRLTGLRSLGTIPRIHPDRKQAGAFKTASALQMLSANVMLALPKRHAGTLMLTSTGRGNGVTSMAVNLAVQVGGAGRRVILVDAHLARPELHELFGVETRTGLSWLLTHAGLPAAEHLIEVDTPGVYLLLAGPASPKADELLASERMELCLTELRELADLVIIDAPSVSAFGGPLALAACVDAVVLLSSAHTRAQVVTTAVTMLRGAGSNIIGLVLSRLNNADRLFTSDAAINEKPANVSPDGVAEPYATSPGLDPRASQSPARGR